MKNQLIIKTSEDNDFDFPLVDSSQSFESPLTPKQRIPFTSIKSPHSLSKSPIRSTSSGSNGSSLFKNDGVLSPEQSPKKVPNVRRKIKKTAVYDESLTLRQIQTEYNLSENRELINNSHISEYLQTMHLQKKYCFTAGGSLIILNPFPWEEKPSDYYSDMETMIESQSQPKYIPSIYRYTYDIYKKILSEKTSQIIFYHGICGSGKSEAWKQSIQLLLFLNESFHSSSKTQKKIESQQDNHHKMQFTTSSHSEKNRQKQHKPTNNEKLGIGNGLPPLGYCSNPYQTKSSTSSSSTQKAIIASILVSEAFGNCVSENNKNASRYVRSMKIHYDPMDQGKIISTELTMYCTELMKTGHILNIQNKNNPCLIFYYFLAGIGMQSESYKINSTQKDSYLSSIPASNYDQSELAKQFVLLQNMILAAGVSEKEWTYCLKVIAACIQLQCLQISGSETTIITQATKAYATHAEYLLGIETGSITNLILKKVDSRSIHRAGGKPIGSSGGSIGSPRPGPDLNAMDNKPSESKSIIDAFCNAIYQRMIHYCLQLCNDQTLSLDARIDPLEKSLYEHLHPSNPPLNTSSSTPSTQLYIHLVDPAGYDRIDLIHPSVGFDGIHDFNHFLLNYMAEKWHLLYIRNEFADCLQQYREEGVMVEKLINRLNQHSIPMTIDETAETARLSIPDVPSIEQFISQFVTELYERPVTGLIALLDEVSANVKGEDRGYIDKIIMLHLKEKNKIVRLPSSRVRPTMFTVRHTFGELNYDCSGFIYYNRNQLSEAGQRLIATSSIPFLVLKDETAATAPLMTVQSNESLANFSPPPPPPPTPTLGGRPPPPPSPSFSPRPPPPLPSPIAPFSPAATPPKPPPPPSPSLSTPNPLNPTTIEKTASAIIIPPFRYTFTQLKDRFNTFLTQLQTELSGQTTVPTAETSSPVVTTKKMLHRTDSFKDLPQPQRHLTPDRRRLYPVHPKISHVLCISALSPGVAIDYGNTIQDGSIGNVTPGSRPNATSLTTSASANKGMGMGSTMNRRGSAINSLRTKRFDASYVEEQLRYFSLSTLLEFDREGYRSVMKYLDFYRRYRITLPIDTPQLPYIIPSSHENNKKYLMDLSKNLLQRCLWCIHVHLPPNMDTALTPLYGLSKLFLKPALYTILEEYLSDYLLKYNDASGIIQRNIRMIMIRSRYRVAIHGFIKIQSMYRRILLRRQYLHQRSSINLIKATYRMKVLYRRYHVMKTAVKILEKYFSNFLLIRIRYLRLIRSVNTVRHVVRGFTVRYTALNTFRAMTMIQICAKRFLRYRRLCHLQHVAACHIQRICRGSYIRRKYNNLVEVLSFRKQQRVAIQVVKKLQAFWRCKLVRLRYDEILLATLTLQHWGRGRLCRLRFLKIMSLTLWCQCVTRRILAIKKVNSLRVKLMVDVEKNKLNALYMEELMQVRQYLNNFSKFSLQSSGNFNGNEWNPTTRLESTPGVGEGPPPHALDRVIGYGLMRHRNMSARFVRCVIGYDIHLDWTLAYPLGWLKIIIQFTRRLKEKEKRSVRKVAMGSQHTVILDDMSNIYTMGLGDRGQLGHNDRKNAVEPRLMSKLSQFLAGTEAGFGKGSSSGSGGTTGSLLSSSNSIGLGGRESSSSSSSLSGSVSVVSNPSDRVHVVDVCCGRDHSLLLTGAGRVYSWGDNRRGQLGHSQFESCPSPKLVGDAAKVRHVKAISCGAYHSACICDPGTLYTWGSGECLGRLHSSIGSPRGGTGLNSHTGDCCEPETVPFFTKRRVQQVVSGECHLTVKCSHLTELYAWGVNKQGQLGDGTIISRLTPVSVLLGRPLNESDLLRTELYSGGRHMICVLQGELWGWGWNKYGQVGNGTMDDVLQPVRIPIPPPAVETSTVTRPTVSLVSSVVVGWRHSVVLTKTDHRLYGWGIVRLLDKTKTSTSVPFRETPMDFTTSNSKGYYLYPTLLCHPHVMYGSDLLTLDGCSSSTMSIIALDASSSSNNGVGSKLLRQPPSSSITENYRSSVSPTRSRASPKRMETTQRYPIRTVDKRTFVEPSADAPVEEFKPAGVPPPLGLSVRTAEEVIERFRKEIDRSVLPRSSSSPKRVLSTMSSDSTRRGGATSPMSPSQRVVVQSPSGRSALLTTSNDGMKLPSFLPHSKRSPSPNISKKSKFPKIPPVSHEGLLELFSPSNLSSIKQTRLHMNETNDEGLSDEVQPLDEGSSLRNRYQTGLYTSFSVRKGSLSSPSGQTSRRGTLKPVDGSDHLQNASENSAENVPPRRRKSSLSRPNSRKTVSSQEDRNLPPSSSSSVKMGYGVGMPRSEKIFLNAFMNKYKSSGVTSVGTSGIKVEESPSVLTTTRPIVTSPTVPSKSSSSKMKVSGWKPGLNWEAVSLSNWEGSQPPSTSSVVKKGLNSLTTTHRSDDKLDVYMRLSKNMKPSGSEEMKSRNAGGGSLSGQTSAISSVANEDRGGVFFKNKAKKSSSTMLNPMISSMMYDVNAMGGVGGGGGQDGSPVVTSFASKLVSRSNVWYEEEGGGGGGGRSRTMDTMMDTMMDTTNRPSTSSIKGPGPDLKRSTDGYMGGGQNPVGGGGGLSTRDTTVSSGKFVQNVAMTRRLSFETTSKVSGSSGSGGLRGNRTSPMVPSMMDHHHQVVGEDYMGLDSAIEKLRDNMHHHYRQRSVTSSTASQRPTRDTFRSPSGQTGSGFSYAPVSSFQRKSSG